MVVERHRVWDLLVDAIDSDRDLAVGDMLWRRSKHQREVVEYGEAACETVETQTQFSWTSEPCHAAFSRVRTRPREGVLIVQAAACPIRSSEASCNAEHDAEKSPACTKPTFPSLSSWHECVVWSREARSFKGPQCATRHRQKTLFGWLAPVSTAAYRSRTGAYVVH